MLDSTTNRLDERSFGRGNDGKSEDPTRSTRAFTFRSAPPKYFWDLLSREVPLNHAMWRTNELVALSGLQVRAPVLDIGCGDGLFASILFADPVDMGIDLWPNRLFTALTRGTYRNVRQANAAALPFDDASFGTAFSNSVLEHISQIDHVCAEVARVLLPGGYFVFTVPSNQFARFLFYPKTLRRLGLSGLANLYAAVVNRVFHHYNCDGPESWEPRLARVGLEIERYSLIMPPELEAVWDLLMPIAALQLMVKRLVPGWPLLLQRTLSRPFEGWILSQVKRGDLEVGGNLLVIARKRS